MSVSFWLTSGNWFESIKQQILKNCRILWASITTPVARQNSKADIHVLRTRPLIGDWIIFSPISIYCPSCYLSAVSMTEHWYNIADLIKGIIFSGIQSILKRKGRTSSFQNNSKNGKLSGKKTTFSNLKRDFIANSTLQHNTFGKLFEVTWKVKKE